MTRTEIVTKWVIDKVKDETIDFAKDHPWRENGLHTLQHGLRVYQYIEKIIEGEKLDITEHEMELIKISTLIHDIGKINDEKPFKDHGFRSMDMALEFLETLCSDDEIKIIEEIVHNHSFKKKDDVSLYTKLIHDADNIDEYGVQSILMCSNWVNKATPFFFKELESRIHTHEIPFGDKLINSMRFETSKDIVKGKMEYVKNIYEHLKEENAGSLDYETYLTL